ncbi:hypothetical protein [Rubrobacter indicoceani]|uniref:hypothetical protein n=1 Tax=Rubrobacter indicoceani TaxID=2051957 RepID=UPI000E5C07A8|nr:hypothetical protein [Rubrobacter indicoceani]
MERREERPVGVPVLAPEYGYEIEPDGLTVYVGDSEEKEVILHFSDGWTPDGVEREVQRWEDETTAFAEVFFAMWRVLFPNGPDPNEV